MIEFLVKLLDFIGIKTFMLSLLISTLSYISIKPSIPLAIIFFCSTFLFVSLIIGLYEFVKNHRKLKNEISEEIFSIDNHSRNIYATFKRIYLYNNKEWKIIEEILKGSKDPTSDNIFILDNHMSIQLMFQIRDFVRCNNLLDIDNKPLIVANSQGGQFGKQIIVVWIEAQTLRLINSIRDDVKLS